MHMHSFSYNAVFQCSTVSKK